MNRRVEVLSLALAVILNLTIYPTKGRGEDMIIQKGSQVSFDYTLTVDGKVLESSEGKAPFQYTHGEATIISGLSKGLEGLKVSEEKRIVVPPEEAYGRFNPDAFQEVSRSQLPPDMKPEIGMSLQAKDKLGRVIVLRIAEIKENSVVLDLNHPLAGKTLTFDVKIVSIK